ncbi:MAG: TrmH family RNA methyltransferase [Sphingomonadales bacterium]
MSGYFGIGIIGVSKAGNAGNLIRTANAFGAQFVFLVRPEFRRNVDKFDTAKSSSAIPVFEAGAFSELPLPQGAEVVGVELTDEAAELPRFAHPRRAVYVFGGERISLPDDVMATCQHIVKIPTKFSLNVATAGAIVMYDRFRARQVKGDRPLWPGAPAPDPQQHKHGGPIFRKGRPDEMTE